MPARKSVGIAGTHSCRFLLFQQQRASGSLRRANLSHALQRQPPRPLNTILTESFVKNTVLLYSSPTNVVGIARLIRSKIPTQM
eukprot:6382750-Amphidinium_carterae.1